MTKKPVGRPRKLATKKQSRTEYLGEVVFECTSLVVHLEERISRLYRLVAALGLSTLFTLAIITWRLITK